MIIGENIRIYIYIFWGGREIMEKKGEYFNILRSIIRFSSLGIRIFTEIQIYRVPFFREVGWKRNVLDCPFPRVRQNRQRSFEHLWGGKVAAQPRGKWSEPMLKWSELDGEGTVLA